MSILIKGIDMPKEHPLWMVIHPNGQVWMRKRYFCQNLEGVEATDLDLVRCIDCKHSKEWYGDRRLCYLWAEVAVFEDGYCNYGERRKQ